MTDADVIKKLGGFTKVAKALDLDRRVVHHWKTRPSGISIGGRYKIRRLAKRMRVNLRGWRFANEDAE